MALAVRQQQKFVAGVKLDQRAGRFGPRQRFLPAMIGEHSFDKVFPQRRIVQPAFFFDRQQCWSCHYGCGKEAAPTARRHTFGIVNAHALDPAVRRILLKHVARQPEVGQFVCSDSGKTLHGHRPISARALGDHFGIAQRADQANCFPRHTHADFNLRADRNPFDKTAESFTEKGILFVAAVEANFLAQQAGADSQAWTGA